MSDKSKAIATTGYLAISLAAKRLGLSVRRLREIAAEGKVRTIRAIDPVTHREGILFHAADIGAFRDRETAERNRQIAAQEPTPRIWLTTDESAEVTGLSAQLLARLIRAGTLPALADHGRGNARWRIRRSDLDAIAGVKRPA